MTREAHLSVGQAGEKAGARLTVSAGGAAAGAAGSAALGAASTHRPARHRSRGTLRIAISPAEMRSLTQLYDDGRSDVDLAKTRVQEAADAMAALSGVPGLADQVRDLVGYCSNLMTSLSRLSGELGSDADTIDGTRRGGEKADSGPGLTKAQSRLIATLRKEGVQPAVIAKVTDQLLARDRRAVQAKAEHRQHQRQAERHERQDQIDRGVPAALARYTWGALPPSQLTAVAPNVTLWSPAAAAFQRMQLAARTAHLGDLPILPGYTPQTLGQPKNLTPEMIAHGWGLGVAIDLRNPRVAAWLKDNAARFGFSPIHAGDWGDLAYHAC